MTGSAKWVKPHEVKSRNFSTSDGTTRIRKNYWPILGIADVVTKSRRTGDSPDWHARIETMWNLATDANEVEIKPQIASYALTPWLGWHKYTDITLLLRKWVSVSRRVQISNIAPKGPFHELTLDEITFTSAYATQTRTQQSYK